MTVLIEICFKLLDDEEETTFQVKKSSQSRKIMKQRKAERRRKKEEQDEDEREDEQRKTSSRASPVANVIEPELEIKFKDTVKVKKDEVKSWVLTGKEAEALHLEEEDRSDQSDDEVSNEPWRDVLRSKDGDLFNFRKVF